MSLVPDVQEYYAIFDDFLDFEIRPWDAHGYDQGQMFPERKVALRYLKLAMNIAKADLSLLPKNFLTFMEEYQPEDYKAPESQVKDKKRTMYTDLVTEVKAMNNNDKGNNYTAPNNSTGLSNKSMQGFDLSARRGAKSYDVIEKKESRLVGKTSHGERYLDISTRSVFWDVPGEDSINPERFDWRRYASKEDVERYEQDLENKNKKGKKTK